MTLWLVADSVQEMNRKLEVFSLILKHWKLKVNIIETKLSVAIEDRKVRETNRPIRKGNRNRTYKTVLLPGQNNN